MKIMQPGIATSGVFRPLPTRRKLFQGIFTGHAAYSCSNITPAPLYRKCRRWFSLISSAIPLGQRDLRLTRRGRRAKMSREGELKTEIPVQMNRHWGEDQ